MNSTESGEKKSLQRGMKNIVKYRDIRFLLPFVSGLSLLVVAILFSSVLTTDFFALFGFIAGVAVLLSLAIVVSGPTATVGYLPSSERRRTQRINDYSFYLLYILSWTFMSAVCVVIVVNTMTLPAGDAFELALLLLIGPTSALFLAHRSSYGHYRRRSVIPLIKCGRVARWESEIAISNLVTEMSVKLGFEGLAKVLFIGSLFDKNSDQGKVDFQALKHGEEAVILVTYKPEGTSILRPDEIETVVAHEIMHLKEDADPVEHKFIIEKRVSAIFWTFLLFMFLTAFLPIAGSMFIQNYYGISSDLVGMSIGDYFSYMYIEVFLLIAAVGMGLMLLVTYGSVYGFNTIRFIELRSDFMAMVVTGHPFSLVTALSKLEKQERHRGSTRKEDAHLTGLFHVGFLDYLFEENRTFVNASDRVRLARITDGLLREDIGLNFKCQYSKSDVPKLGLGSDRYDKADAIYRTIREGGAMLGLRSSIEGSEEKIGGSVTPEEFFTVFASIVTSKLATVEFKLDKLQSST